MPKSPVWLTVITLAAITAVGMIAAAWLGYGVARLLWIIVMSLP